MLNRTPPWRHRRSRHQSGVTLIEALVALIVMSFGMMALVGLMSNLRRGSDLAKQRGEAMRLAQSELALMRSYSAFSSVDPTVIAFDNSPKAKDSIISKTRTETPSDSNTTFTVNRIVNDVQFGNVVVAKSVRVVVNWVDRTNTQGNGAGTPQSVTMDTLIARMDLGFVGAAGIAPPPGGTRQPSGRHPAIPVAAKDLGNGKSAFLPRKGDKTIWVFNNVTGLVVSSCVLADGQSTVMAEADLTSCDTRNGYLISGTIRFSNTNPANPATPEAYAFPLDLAFTSAYYRFPALDENGVPITKDNQWIMQDLPASPPASDHVKCFNDSPSGLSLTQQFVNYNCVVWQDESSSKKSWSGKLILTGFKVGNTGSDYRVCRYSADYNGNGTAFTKPGGWVIDNYEHPEVYVDVTSPLPRQNFLVIKAADANGTSVSCPSAPDVDPSHQIFVDYKTVQIQP